MKFLEKLTARMPFSKKSEGTEYFFALNIGLSEVTAVVWAIFGRELDLLSQKTLPYENHDDLLEKAYQALDKTVGTLEVEPKKVLFGVPDLWSVDDNLKEPYLKLLQKLLKECALEPVAYVATTNAISFLLQKQEGIPPTAILLGLGDFVEVTLIRGGKVAGTRTTQRSEYLFDDIEKILNQFTEVEVLPSKILLYSTKTDLDLGKIKDDLMSYPWMQKLSFLHFPKIEILDEGIADQAIVLAGASEMYPEVDFKHNFIQKQVEAKETYIKTLPQERRDEVGFVKGDIKVREVREEKTEETEMEEREEPKELASIKDKGLENDNLIPPVFMSAAFVRVQKAFSLLKITPKNSRLLAIPIILLVLVLAYLFLVKTTVTVFVEPKILEKETDVVADPKATSISEDQKTIPGKIVETTISGSGKEVASGTKQIGDPAKGKVVIYNKSDSVKSFSQGTILVSSDNLKFALDLSVQVASKSSSVGPEGEITKWGKSDSVGVTAVALGPESNLPGGINLTIGSYAQSQVVARVEEALSGGTSKNVTVVTSDDQKKLKAKVLDELRQKAESELAGKMSEGQKIIADALSVVDGKYNFSKQVNDQAKEFSLSATVRFKGTSYSDIDLRTVVAKLVTIEVPEGFEMNLQNAETQADVAKVDKDGKVTFRAKFRAKLLPKFKSDDLKKQIQGKSVAEAAASLKSLESVIGSEIKLRPNLPAPIARMPLLLQNITINITPK